MSANERQVGGDHYKTGGEEHWDRVARLGLDYFQGQITKYVERCKKKGKLLEDLEKARHFLDKYIEINSPAKVLDKVPDNTFQAGIGPKAERLEGIGHYAGLDRDGIDHTRKVGQTVSPRTDAVRCGAYIDAGVSCNLYYNHLGDHRMVLTPEPPIRPDSPE